MTKLLLSILSVGIFLSLQPSVSFAVEEALPSIYDLKSTWKDTRNQDVKLNLANDGLVVMTMVYLGCGHACPMTVAKMKEIEASLTKAGVEQVKFVLVSFDHKRDRPEKMAKYLKSKNLDPKKWLLLTGNSENDVRELAVVLGISYKDLGDGDFSHSNTISLLDKGGAVIATVNGLSSPHDALVEVANKYLKKK